MSLTVLLSFSNTDEAGHEEAAAQPSVELRKSEPLSYDVHIGGRDADLPDISFGHAHAKDGKHIHICNRLPREAFPTTLRVFDI